MIELRRMTQAEYDACYPDALQSLASELARAHGAAPEAMLPSAARSFESLLPGGKLDAPDQHLFVLLAGGRRVGVLWFGVRRDRPEPEAYVWDLVIDPPFRGQGYGRQAMGSLIASHRGRNAPTLTVRRKEPLA